MIVTFWGVRGSVPTPGAHTLRYGGNTACVTVEVGDKLLVLDAGTGIVSLGQSPVPHGRAVFVMLSHLHNDHILGFPFFAPLYDPSQEVHLLSFDQCAPPWSLLTMFDGRHFPMKAEGLAAQIHCVEAEGLAYLAAHGLHVERLAVNHPGGAYGFRVTDAGRTFVFIPDNEIAPPIPGRVSFEELATFCHGADVLAHDAQYRLAQMHTHAGWGHSTLRHVCDLAIAAEVRHLIPFHHDPLRTDDELDAMQAEAQGWLAEHDIHCQFAYEGLRFELS